MGSIFKEIYSENDFDLEDFYVPNDSNKGSVEKKLYEIYGEPFEYGMDTLVFNYLEGKSAREWVVIQEEMLEKGSTAYSVSSGKEIPEELKQELFDISMKGLAKVCLEV